MTTIAFKNGVVASDTGASNRGSRVGHVVKIFARDGHVAGSCGDSGWNASFRKWFASGETGNPPEIRRDAHNNDDAKGVIFRRDGIIEVYESTGMHEVTAPFYAIGSGAAEARGAMQVGASAEEAVRAAMILDDGTYGNVLVLKIGP